MNFKETFLKLTEYTIPFGYEQELEPLLPRGWKKDSIGNYYYEIGNSETLFTSHLDVATDIKAKVNHIIEGNLIKTDGTTILGGDNKAGVTILFYLIQNNVPGTYYFFLGEESAVHKNYPYGSLLAIEKNSEFFKKFKRVIAFDRKQKGELITRQFGYDCCSDEFADALIEEFSKNGVDYKKDKTGYYTDSAFFGGLISEITNLSAGVYNEHTKNEYVDISYIELVAKASSKVKWETLPSVRPVDQEEVDPRSDIDDESTDLSEDQKLFGEVFKILDELYYVCREIRNLSSYVHYFKPGRKYRFTEWHGDDVMIVSVEKGKVLVNDKSFNNLDEFKKHMGIEQLSRMQVANVMFNLFKKGGNKLSLADYERNMYLKGGSTKKLSKDLHRKGWKLNRIGKGYEIVKESFLFRTYKKFISNI